jgi:hypothetical protein
MRGYVRRARPHGAVQADARFVRQCHTGHDGVDSALPGPTGPSRWDETVPSRWHGRGPRQAVSPGDHSPFGPRHRESSPLRGMDAEPPRPCKGALLGGRAGPARRSDRGPRGMGAMATPTRRSRRAVTDDEIRQHQEERQAKLEALHARFTGRSPSSSRAINGAMLPLGTRFHRYSFGMFS